MSDLVFGVKFTADGTQFVGEAKITRESLDGLTEATKRTKSEAERLRDEHQRGGAQMGQYSTAAQTLSAAVKTLAASYAVLKVVQYAKEAALLSARYETLGVSMRIVGNNAGYTSAEMEAAAVGMQKTGISMVESRQQALRLVQAHIDLSQSSKLARIAQDAAVIGNMNSSQAFATMIHGIQTGQTDVLRTIGLNISMEQSYAAYAATLGKSTNALTQTEKTQAVLNAVMKEGEAIAGTYEAAMGTAGKQLNSLARYHDNLKVVVGDTFTEALAGAVGAYTGELKDLNDAAMELKVKGDLKEWGRASALVLAGVADSARMVFNTVGAMASVVERLTVTAAIWANPFASGVPRLRALQDDLKKQQAEFVAGMSDNLKVTDAVSKMFDDIDARAQKSADKRLSIEKEYIAKAQVVAAAYSGTLYQISALQALADSYGGDIKAAHGSAGKLTSGSVADGANERAKAIEAEGKSYVKLNESIAAHIAVLGAQDGADTKLTESQKKLVELGATYKKGLTAQNEAAQQKYITSLALAAGMEMETAAQAAASKAEQEYMSGIGKTTEELILKAQAAEQENATIGLTAEQLAAVTAKRYDEQIALKMAEADRLRGIEGRDAEVSMIEQQVAALDRLKKAEVARPALQAQAEAWKNFTRDIESSLTDALMRGFEGGNNAGENFVNTLRNTLKTAALKIAVQAIVNPVMSGINSMAQGGASGSALGYVNAGQTIWSGFSGGMASSMGGVVSGMGSLFGSAAMGELGAGMAGTFMGPTTAGSMAGIGSTIGAAMPYVAAAYVAYSLLKGNGGTPTSSTGNASMYFDAQGNRTDYQTYYGGSNAGTDAMVAGLQSSYMQAAMSLGIGTVATRFNFGGNTGKNGQSPNFALAGSAGSSSFSQSDTAVSDAAVQLAASRAVFAALQGSKLPDYLSNMFDGLTASSMSQQQISDTLAFAQSLKALRDGLAETRTPLEIATAQMTGLSAEFHTSAATFKQDFVSAIDAGITPQTIARWQQLGTAIDQVTAANEQAAQAAQQAARAQLQAVLSASQSVYDTAKSSLLDAYARESDAAQQLADKMRGFASSFAALRSSLSLGALSTLSPEQKYQEAQRQLDDISRRAQLGDMDAMAQMDSVSQSFLQASRDYNASSEAYAADFARVSGALVASGSVAGRQADIATQQVTLLQAQLSALGLINTSVLSIADARASYSAATNALSTSAAAAGNVAINNANPAGGSSLIDLYRINLGRAPDAAGLAYWSEQFGDSIDAAEAQQFAIAALPEYLSTRSLPGFASGGTHSGGLRIVGERGWEVEATGASRIFNHEQAQRILSGGGDNKELVAELKALRAEVAKLREENAQQANQVVGAVDDAASANTGDLRGLRQSLAHGIGKLAA